MQAQPPEVFIAAHNENTENHRIAANHRNAPNGALKPSVIDFRALLPL